MKPIPAYAPTPCAANDTQCKKELADYNAQQEAQQEQYNAAQKTYEDAMKVYNRNVFIAANIVGIVVFVAGFLLVLYAALAGQGATIGIMMAGLWGIIYGYMRGWDSIDDKLKFFVGLVIAVLVIGGSMWLIQRRQRVKVKKAR
jgi:F0F1-type ATP synthase assembly protein I